MNFRHATVIVVLVACPVTAQAQSTPNDKAEAAEATAPPPVLTVSGSAPIASDYRFRGVSQSDQEMAVQGGIKVAHASGLYAGVWGSNLAGWGTFGGANMELDLIGGYKGELADNATLDVGLTWYMYPGGADKTDFAEPYIKLTGTAGPATLTAGAAYAPKQQAIGRWGTIRNFVREAGLPSDDEALAEDDGELAFGLAPFARWSFPFVRRVIEHQV